MAGARARELLMKDPLPRRCRLTPPLSLARSGEERGCCFRCPSFFFFFLLICPRLRAPPRAAADVWASGAGVRRDVGFSAIVWSGGFFLNEESGGTRMAMLAGTVVY